MKNILITLAIILSSISAIGQTSNSMKFSGVSLNVHINKFIEEMKVQGYTYEKVDEEDKNAYWFKGYFDGEPVSVVASATPLTKTIYFAGAYFDNYKLSKNPLSTIKQKYKSYLKIITNKYGKPKFTDRKEAHNKATITHWSLMNGSVDLSYYEGGDVRMLLGYVDKEALDKYQKEGNVSF